MPGSCLKCLGRLAQHQSLSNLRSWMGKTKHQTESVCSALQTRSYALLLVMQSEIIDDT